MNNVFIIILTAISGFASILGNIFLFIPIKYKERVLSFCFGLSFIVMFLISILDLIPNGLSMVHTSLNRVELVITSLILGIFSLYLINSLNKNIDNDDKLYQIGLLSMITLLLHNIPEGMICAISSTNNISLGLKMTFLIMIHNIPEGICIALPIYYSTKSRLKALLYTIISGLGELTGALLTILFLKPYITNFLLYMIFIITAGIMIYLSCFKILKSGLELKKYKSLLIGIIIGIITIIISSGA